MAPDGSRSRSYTRPGIPRTAGQVASTKVGGQEGWKASTRSATNTKAHGRLTECWRSSRSQLVLVVCCYVLCREGPSHAQPKDHEPQDARNANHKYSHPMARVLIAHAEPEQHSKSTEEDIVEVQVMFGFVIKPDIPWDMIPTNLI
jgi:hypothetical protein